jgi:hypothetical protein
MGSVGRAELAEHQQVDNSSLTGHNLGLVGRLCCGIAFALIEHSPPSQPRWDVFRGSASHPLGNIIVHQPWGAQKGDANNKQL